MGSGLHPMTSFGLQPLCKAKPEGVSEAERPVRRHFNHPPERRVCLGQGDGHEGGRR